MDKQTKLFSNVLWDDEEEAEPEIRVVKNVYLMANAMVKEIVIKKTYIKPLRKI